MLDAKKISPAPTDLTPQSCPRSGNLIKKFSKSLGFTSFLNLHRGGFTSSLNLHRGGCGDNHAWDWLTHQLR